MVEIIEHRIYRSNPKYWDREARTEVRPRSDATELFATHPLVFRNKSKMHKFWDKYIKAILIPYVN